MVQHVVQIFKPSFMADGSIRWTFEFGEQTPDEVKNMCELMKKNLVMTLVTEEDYRAAMEK